MASTYMDSVIKEKLKLQHSTLNLAPLKSDIAELQDKLYVSVKKRKLYYQKQLFKGTQNNKILT
jgi:hypothetical protein